MMEFDFGNWIRRRTIVKQDPKMNRPLEIVQTLIKFNMKIIWLL